MELEFQYNTIITTINSNKDSKMIDACQQFCTKEKTSLNKVSFLYSGKVLKNELELTIQNVANNNDNERNKMNLLVIGKEENIIQEEKSKLIKSKNIVCPQCGELGKISIEDYRYKISECKNYHETNNISVNKLQDNLMIDISKIICDECKINKSASEKNDFYRCNACQKNLCSICKARHNKEHKIIKHEEKDFICESHNEKYIYYCKDCKFNLCEDCLKTKSKYNNKTGKHTKHETHTKIKLSKNRKTIKFISKALKNLSNKSYKNNNIINLISNLNQNYKEFKSYNAYKTLKNAAKFLKNLKKISPLSIDEGFELKYEELIKINSIEELRKNINKSNLIYKIEINGEKTKETMEDFSIFEGKDFSELKVLCLNEIKLKNISNLSSCSCPKLKRVDFECNLIGDDSINAFKNIKPQYINLFDNKITSIKILEVIKNNENLKEFYIGKNPLIAKDDEIMNCNNIYKYHLSQKIEKLGLTNLFDQKTVEFILNQGIENIKVLYIGSYGFSSFKIF